MHRPIEIDLAGRDQLHDEISEHRLAQGGGGEDGVLGDRQPSLHVPIAVALDERQFTAVVDGDGCARHFGGAHQPDDGRVRGSQPECGGIEPVKGGAAFRRVSGRAARRRGQGERQQQGERPHGGHLVTCLIESEQSVAHWTGAKLPE